MASIWDWSTTASNNDDADSTINWLENMVPGDVNNSARAMMARIAQFRRDLGGTVTATGSANAIAVTANSSFSALADGLIVSFVAANDNTGAATLAANGLTAKSIRIMTTSGDTALSGGEIQAGGVFLCIYNTALNSAAGGWQLINPASAGYQPLDADLTAIAAIAPSNDDIIQRKAGAWTNRTIAQLLTDLAAAGTTFQPLDSDLTAIAALTTTSFGRAVLALADAAALRTAAGLTADGQSLVTAANYAAMRTLLDLEVGTDFLSPAAIAAAYQPLDSDLTAWAAVNPSSYSTTATIAATYAPIANPTFTGVASFPDGSASAPSITHTGDTNAGIYFGTDIINFATAGTFAAMFDASQQFVLGHTTAIAVGSSSNTQSAFQTHGITGAAASISAYRWSNNTGPALMQGAKSRGATAGTRAVVQSGDGLLQINGFGDDGTHFPPAARIAIEVDGTPGAGDMPGRIVFLTTTDGGVTLVEAVRIDNARNLQMGGTNTVIDVNRHFQLRSYAKASLPSAATAGQLIYVSDDTGGATPAFSDGTNWRRVADRNVIS